MKAQTIEMGVIGFIVIYGFFTNWRLVLAVAFGYLLKWLFVLISKNNKSERDFKTELFIDKSKSTSLVRLIYKNNEPFLWEAKIGKKTYVSPLDRRGVLEI